MFDPLFEIDVTKVPEALGNVTVRLAESVAVVKVTRYVDEPPALPWIMIPSFVVAGANVCPVAL